MIFVKFSHLSSIEQELNRSMKLQGGGVTVDTEFGDRKQYIKQIHITISIVATITVRFVVTNGSIIMRCFHFIAGSLTAGDKWHL